MKAQITEMHQTKLIVLRGNSASGKSTVARRLRRISSRKIALVEQDNIRRNILKEKETDGGANIALISQIAEFALARDYDVILEGILKFQRYGGMIKELIAKCPEHYVYYFDIPFDETLRRHATKPIADDVSEGLLKSWYTPHDVTGFVNEQIIPERYSLDQTVERVLAETGL